MRAILLVLAAAPLGCRPGVASSGVGWPALLAQTVGADTDGDGLLDDGDNCVDAPNPVQGDADADGLGDACDDPPDLDRDGIVDNVDLCPGVSDPDQPDGDADARGDGCDNCPTDFNPDQSDGDLDGVGDVCPCDGCAPTQFCVQHPAGWEACVDECSPDERMGPGGVCCPIGARFDADAGACLLADVEVDRDRLLDSIGYDATVVEPDSCELVEGCVGAAGLRRLLRFDTTTPNQGEGDLFVGEPPPDGEDGGLFLWSGCHEHHHFDTYAYYELVDASGGVVAPGHKQAFCLMDYEPWSPGIAWEARAYDCTRQGITSGFADTYRAGLDCQYVDVTDVPEGDYVLRISLNYEHVLAESDYSNNVTEIPVHIPAP